MLARIAFCLLAASLAALSTGCSDLGDRVVALPQSELSATSLDFGTVVVHQSATRTLTLRNRGTGALEGTAALTGAGYEFVSGGGPFDVAPGNARNVVLRFTPSDIGSFPGTLDLGPNAPAVALTGIGALQAAGAQCLVLPAEVDFGSVPKGQTASRSFQVFSVGTAQLLVNVVSNAADVQVLAGGGAATLDPGTSRTVVLIFSPQSGGPISGTVVVGPGCPEVALLGIGRTVSFARVALILDSYCTGCHADFPPFVGPEYLVNYTSVGYPPFVRVKPFDLVNSVLYGKITNSGQFGGMMPQGGSLLPQRDRDTIRDWILEGASGE